MQGFIPTTQALDSIGNMSKTGAPGQAGGVSAPEGPKLVPPTDSEIKTFNAAKTPEINASLPQQSNKIVNDISDRLNSLAGNYNDMQADIARKPDGVDGVSKTDQEAGAGGGKNTLAANEAHFQEMFNRFQDMQMFTVRANLVTNGASSSTHTFNSLLKGQ